jgi:hypothetical protein
VNIDIQIQISIQRSWKSFSFFPRSSFSRSSFIYIKRIFSSFVDRYSNSLLGCIGGFTFIVSVLPSVLRSSYPPPQSLLEMKFAKRENAPGFSAT